MYYVMSDINGCYDKFIEMTEDILGLEEDDTLYLLGNIIGSDENSVKLLKEIADMVNVYPIMGVNEYAAYNALKSLNKDISDGKDYTSLSQETLDAMAKLNELGCRKLAEDFLKLSDDERNDFIDVLGDMKPYDTVEVNKKIFILVHQGLGNFEKNGKKLKSYTVEDLAFTPVDYRKRYFKDNGVYIVSGHVPVSEITGSSENAEELFICENNICINCNAANGGTLACLCLDDMKDFYTD